MTLKAYEFYEIQSAKSLELVDGLRKVSLFCAEQPDIYCFMWFRQDHLEQVQFIFEEKVIHWIQGRGWNTGETNRKREILQKTGHQKGVRSIHQAWNPKILKDATEIIRNSSFPDNYQQNLVDKLDQEDQRV